MLRRLETSESSAMHSQALDLFGGLPSRHVEPLFERASVVDLCSLPRGLWLGRLCGGLWPFRWTARRILRRASFARFVLESWGVGVRVSQDGSHRLEDDGAGGVALEFPFALGWDTFDYGLHVMGQDFGVPPVVWQDEARVLPLAELVAHAPHYHLRRVGFDFNDRSGLAQSSGLMVLGYTALGGIHRLRGLPFAMVYHRPTSRREEAMAWDYVARRRILDTSPGPLRIRPRGPAPVPSPT